MGHHRVLADLIRSQRAILSKRNCVIKAPVFRPGLFVFRRCFCRMYFSVGARLNNQFGDFQ